MTTVSRFARLTYGFTLLFCIAAFAATPQAQAQNTRYNYSGTYTLPSGDQLIVEAEDTGLRVEAIGEEALALITGAGVAPKVAAQRNRNTARILDGLQRGDMTAMQQKLPRQTRDQALADLNRYIWMHVGAFGPIQGYEVLGTRVNAKASEETFARVQFGTETIVLRFIWAGDNLVTIAQGTQHMAIHLEPHVGSQFAQNAAEGNCKMTFAPTSDGSIAGLTVESSFGRAEAWRTDLSAQANR